MYIKREDYEYFRDLFNCLDEGKQQRFLDAFLKSGSSKTGLDITKIKIIDDSIYDIQAIEPSEMITRTMIKKAFKSVRGGK